MKTIRLTIALAVILSALQLNAQNTQPEPISGKALTQTPPKAALKISALSATLLLCVKQNIIAP